MKVLFLDIDGVLNHEEFFVKRHEIKDLSEIPSYPLSEFDCYCVERLNEILDVTEAKLVVSSGWRFDTNLKNIFKKVGIKHDIFDVTPYGMGKCRGVEIQSYIENHKDEIDGYCIVDDDNDMLDCQSSHFVRTSFQTGLTEEVKEKIIDVLNNC